jgi:hypothetical protein
MSRRRSEPCYRHAWLSQMRQVLCSQQTTPNQSLGMPPSRLSYDDERPLCGARMAKGYFRSGSPAAIPEPCEA